MDDGLPRPERHKQAVQRKRPLHHTNDSPTLGSEAVRIPAKGAFAVWLHLPHQALWGTRLCPTPNSSHLHQPLCRLASPSSAASGAHTGLSVPNTSLPGCVRYQVLETQRQTRTPPSPGGQPQSTQPQKVWAHPVGKGKRATTGWPFRRQLEVSMTLLPLVTNPDSLNLAQESPSQFTQQTVHGSVEGTIRN